MFVNDIVANLLADMEANDAAARETEDDKWIRPRSLHRDSARFLNMLAKAVNARAILEVGTSVGYSTVHLALAARDTGGHVTTVELLPAKYEAAKANLERGELTPFVTQIMGDALEVVPTLSITWDMVFVDPEKELYEPLWPLFRDSVCVGGVVIADNLLSHANDLSGYVRAVRDDGRFETVTVPIGLGLEMSYRVR